MSDLISGKEALIALANGDGVEMMDSDVDMPWTEICVKNNDFFGKVEPCPWMFINTPNHIQFRLKPKTITINGIEVTAPFKPEIGEKVYSLCGFIPEGYESWVVQREVEGRLVWRTEEEIKQVIKALWSIFK